MQHTNRRGMQSVSGWSRADDGHPTSPALEERFLAARLPQPLVALLHDVVRLLARYAGTERRAGRPPRHAERRRES